MKLSEVLLTLMEFVATYLLLFLVCLHVRSAALNPPDSESGSMQMRKWRTKAP